MMMMIIIFLLHSKKRAQRLYELKYWKEPLAPTLLLGNMTKENNGLDKSRLVMETSFVRFTSFFGNSKTTLLRNQ